MQTCLVLVSTVHTSAAPGDTIYPHNIQSRTFTATLVAHRGRAFIVSAGHPWWDLYNDNITASPARKIFDVQITCCPDGMYSQPLSLRNALKIKACDNGVLGLDLSAIEITQAEHDYICGLGAEFVHTEDQTLHMDPDMFVVVGYPHRAPGVPTLLRSHQTIERVGPWIRDSWQYTLQMLQINPCNSHSSPKTIPRFSGRLSCGMYNQNDIVGFSGGPIFALRLDSLGWCANLVAIQSSVADDDLVIYGNYVNSSLDYICFGDGELVSRAGDLRLLEYNYVPN